MRKNSAVLFGGLILVASAVTARADVKVSTKPTQNMTCSAGVCTPTAKQAVLNVTDLANLLAAGDVTVNTAASLAKDIDIDAALTWTGTSRLTLDAYRSIAFNKPMTVAGTGALTITTNDGGSGGDFRFFGKGRVRFWDLSSSLLINGQRYVLVKNIKDLHFKLRHNLDGFYALANNIKLSRTYGASPIPKLGGTLEGLGNVISNLSIQYTSGFDYVGLIGWLLFDGTNTATIRDVGLVNVQSSASGGCIGGLVGKNTGMIVNSFIDGQITASTSTTAGGLVCFNDAGTIVRSSSAADVSGSDHSIMAGLVGLNEGACSDLCPGLIDQSYATGSISGGDFSMVGGLVGRNLAGSLTNSYATGSVKAGGSAFVGGLIGSNENNPEQRSHPFVAKSYSKGSVSADNGALIGGVVGEDLASRSFRHTIF